MASGESGETEGWGEGEVEMEGWGEGEVERGEEA
jgi:hypothetical protein